MNLQLAMMLAFSKSSAPVALAGEVVWSTPGTIQWTVPAGVFEVSSLCIGGGTGDGSLITSPSTSFFKNESTCVGYGSSDKVGGGFVGGGGGKGGEGGIGYVWTVEGFDDDYIGGGGGGAGGYTGNGGKGIAATSSQSSPGFGGGGVGIFGQGTSGGTAKWHTALPSTNSAGSGGSGGGGASGRTHENLNNPEYYGKGGSGGTDGASSSMGSYGGGQAGLIVGRYTESQMNGMGGGGLGWRNSIKVTPGEVITIKVGKNGVVRVIWGGGRSFPLNAAKM